MKSWKKPKSTFDKPPFKYYFFQLFGATLFICAVLFVMDTYSVSHIIWAVGASSLASSAYVVFMHPHGLAAKPKNIFLAYTMAVIVGEIIRAMMLWYGASCHLPFNTIAANHHFWFAAAISVTTVMILMATFDIEHPPASGIALVLVVELCRHDIVDMIYGFMLLICIIQLICRPYMRNLLR
jgi:hypothetical protein